MAKVWEPAFPQLGTYEDHSPATPPGGPFTPYNCWAFAAGESLKRWEPDPSNQYFWPAEAPREYTIPAFVAAYGTIGYERCSDGSLEVSYEKIVIYTTPDGVVRHAARQLSDGRWISKMGHAEDIIHGTPEALNNSPYGQAVLYMGRPRPRVWQPIHGWFGNFRFLLAS